MGPWVTQQIKSAHEAHLLEFLYVFYTEYSICEYFGIIMTVQLALSISGCTRWCLCPLVALQVKKEPTANQKSWGISASRTTHQIKGNIGPNIHSISHDSQSPESAVFDLNSIKLLSSTTTENKL